MRNPNFPVRFHWDFERPTSVLVWEREGCFIGYVCVWIWAAVVGDQQLRVALPSYRVQQVDHCWCLCVWVWDTRMMILRYKLMSILATN
jgi:hypothetical protein